MQVLARRSNLTLILASRRPAFTHTCANTHTHTHSPVCPTCGFEENVEHVFFQCPRFLSEREELRQQFGEVPTPETIVGLMLKSQDNRELVGNVTAKVMKEEEDRDPNSNIGGRAVKQLRPLPAVRLTAVPWGELRLKREWVGLVGKNPKLSWGTGHRVSFEDSSHPRKNKNTHTGLVRLSGASAPSLSEKLGV